MAKSARPVDRPSRRRRAPAAADKPPPSRRRSRRRSVWPLALLVLAVWALIFVGLFYAHFLSEMPDVKKLMAAAPSRDITILDIHHRLIARRGLTQGQKVT